MHNENLPIYDKLDIKNEIKKYKQQLLLLQSENQSLTSQIQILTEEATKLRSEKNSIEHNEQLMLAPSDDINCFVNHDKFTEWNAKLELKILNIDIKSRLKELETQAQTVEKLAWGSSKNAKLSQSVIISDFLLSSRDEMRQEIDNVETSLAHLQQVIRDDLQTSEIEKSSISREVSKLRRQLNDKKAEKDDYDENLRKYRQKFLEEEAKVDWLIRKQESLKHSIGKYNRDRDGWMTEAFLRSVQGSGGLKGFVKVVELESTLSLWISPDILDSIDFKDLLIERFHTGDDSISYQQFVDICQHLEAKSLDSAR